MLGDSRSFKALGKGTKSYAAFVFLKEYTVTTTTKGPEKFVVPDAPHPLLSTQNLVWLTNATFFLDGISSCMDMYNCTLC